MISGMAGSTPSFWKSAFAEAMIRSIPSAWTDGKRVLRKTVGACLVITIFWRFCRTRPMSDMRKCGSGLVKTSIRERFPWRL
jgi:hypothetical protein